MRFRPQGMDPSYRGPSPHQAVDHGKGKLRDSLRESYATDIRQINKPLDRTQKNAYWLCRARQPWNLGV